MQELVLNILKSTDGYVSGAEIGERLGVSRTAIWKAISKLKAEGYNIEAVNNKGYHLIDDSDIINSQEIKDILETKLIGKNVVFYPEVSSTNDVVKELGENDGIEGTVVVAEKQTNGRGRRGRKWESEKGSGLWFSILLRPDIDPRNAPMITLIAGISVCVASRRVTGLPVTIKWPNDVIIDNKKICGILTEMSSEIGNINYVVVGIGVNVNSESFPDDISDIATSLKIESNKNIKRKVLLNEILKEFENNYLDYIKDCDFSKFRDKYRELCSTINQEINVIGRETYPATAIDINENGELIVEKSDGSREVVFSGEVSIRKR